MDVLIEMFLSAVVALAAAVFAHFGVPLSGDDADEGRAVRRSPVAVAAPAGAHVTRITSEDCPDELKVRRAVIHADAETIAPERLHEAVRTTLAQADEDAADAAAMAAEMLAEREAARLEAEAERAQALAERARDLVEHAQDLAERHADAAA